MFFKKYVIKKVADFRNTIQAFCYRKRPYKDPVETIEFFSIVLNGMPFVRCQYETFKALKIPWRWHIVEGVAELKKDTAWSVKLGGYLPDGFHRGCKSVDGTTEYLDSISSEDQDRVLIYRKPTGIAWDGKVEMCRIFMPNIRNGSLLWQVDVDEIWKPWQIEKILKMFQEEPARTAAWFNCNYFVGPGVAVMKGEPYTKNWLRVWRFEEGMNWVSHEPPKLGRRDILGCANMGRLYPFSMEETERRGLVFDHYAYVFPQQVKFKESYYGYKGLCETWEKIKEWDSFPESIRTFFPAVVEDQLVEKRDSEFFSSNAFLEWNSRKEGE